MRNLKKFLALVLATLMVVGAMVATTVSAAEADHSNAVEVLNRVDVYRGYGDAMGDKDLVTRWHMALFVSRITTGFTNDSAWNTEKNDTPFTDVTKDNYLGAISTAYKAGIIEGVGDNKFDPQANIKYQDALTMVVRALGFKNLDYPLGYIQKAQALGLTDNLNELDNKLDTAITRGQTAEILYNALFVECKDGTTLGEDVLKLELADVVVVATENQTFGYAELAKKGKVVLYNKAEKEYITVNASELLAEGETVDDLLGYSIKIATNNNWQTLVTAYRCDSAVLANYGTDKTQISFVQQGVAPNVVARTNMIKLNGTNYSWNGGMSGYPDFVAYEATTMATGKANIKIHYYDTDGNIVEPTSGRILLYKLNGKYYINVGSAGFQALREATAAEIEAAKCDLYVSEGVLDEYTTFECYSQVQECAKLWKNKFCELKVFDDNGDGKWDRGLFTPYYVGVYTTGKSTNQKVMNFAKNSTSSSANQVVIKIDGNDLAGYKDSTRAAATLASGATFVGGTPAVGDTVIYTYNAFTGVFRVVENLGTYKRGAATEINGRGSYVVIDGNKLSYNLTTENLRGWEAADIRVPLLQAVITDGTFAVDYLATAGYLIETSKLNPYGYTSYVAFQPSDIRSIDAAGNLVVNAIIDATGVKKEVKIASMNGYRVGARLAYELNKEDSGAADSFVVGSVAPKYTNADIIQAYLKAMNTNPKMDDHINTTVFAGKINNDGTYALVPFTPLTSYDPVTNKNDRDEVNIVNNMTKAVITLNYGINNKAYVSSVASEDKLIATAGKFDTTASTVYIFAGRDAIHTFKGVAKNGSTIDLTGANTVLLSATSDCVFVYDATKTASELYKGWEVTSTPIVDKDYVFYAVVAGTKAYVSNAGGDNKATLTVTGLYNVLTGETVDVIVTADANTVVYPVFEQINAHDKWLVSNVSDNCAAVILFSASEGRFEISTLSDKVLEDFGTYVDALWANYKDPYIGADLGNLNDPYNLVVNGASVPVQSYAIKAFWGYTGAVEVVDGSTVKGNFTKNPNTDKAFIAIDANGNAFGYVFAHGMAK